MRLGRLFALLSTFVTVSVAACSESSPTTGPAEAPSAPAGDAPPSPPDADVAQPDAAAPGTGPVRDVVISSDCGTEIDDQWAIVYALSSPKLHVDALLSTHAPNLPALSAEHSANVMRDIETSVLALTHPPPVAVGSSTPMKDENTPVVSDAVTALLDASRGHGPEDRLVVIGLGALTDIGSALLRDPSLADRIDLRLMGFVDWPAGGDSWNVKNDPAAARVVLASRAPVTIGSETVARAHLGITRASAAAHVGAHGGAPGKWLLSATNYFFDLYEAQVHGAWTIWDLVVFADLDGLAVADVKPRPKLKADLSFDVASTDGLTWRWITTVDEAKVWSTYESTLDAAYAR